MIIVDSTETLLLRGLAALLQAGGVGTYGAPGAVAPVGTPTSPAIIVGDMPEGVECAIGLIDYQVNDEPGLADAVIGVQVVMRGNRTPDVARNFAGAVFSVFQGYRGLAGTIRVDQIFRQSYAALGPDGRGRFERSENYYVQLNRPGVIEG